MSSELTVRIPGGMDEAAASVRAALQDEGFGVLTEIDVEATLRAKLGDRQADEVGPTRILGACNPVLAHLALTTERDVAMLLPCNVVLRSVEGDTEVCIADPADMIDVAGASLTEVATAARSRLLRVAAALRG
jgi:uncharacterized protein (DUF302 family)